MTWENDKNETATQIYSFIADFDEKIYANEERREDSLIQQAAHMQTAFSFVSAALFMVAAIIIDNRGRISLEFLLVAFSSIILRICPLVFRSKKPSGICMIFLIAVRRILVSTRNAAKCKSISPAK